MKNQIQLYSIDTRAFYNKGERIKNKHFCKVSSVINLIEEFVLIKNADNKYKDTYDTLGKLHKALQNKHIKKYINNLKKQNKEYIKSDAFEKLLAQNINEKQKKFYYKWTHSERKTKTSEGIKSKSEILKNALNTLLENNKEVRNLIPNKLNNYNKIATFDSDLVRTLNLATNEITTDIIVIRTFHYCVLRQLICDGFNHGEDHYIFFTASAGQIRKKKIVMIKESVWDKHKDTLTCGLSRETINKLGGANINKYLAYLSLISSATDEWIDFDITKAIVIPDFETDVEGNFDYIEKKEKTRDIKDENGEVKTETYYELQTPELNKPMTVTIPHSDGCGIILEGDKNFQFRLAWFKGLLTPVDVIGWADQYNNSSYKIVDIYGKEWDIKADDIKYIFVESQFKMHKFYNSWKEYQDNFIKYGCKASKCNIEEDTFKRPKFCYQMWQTLKDVTDIEIEHYTNIVDSNITNAYTDRNTMLQMLGITEDNNNKSYLQNCVEIYPELLQDSYIKAQLSDAINSKKKKAKSGKFTLDGASTFLLPDVVAWMQFIFLGKDKATGLLESGQVHCKLFNIKQYPQLIVNRSPHLGKEHGLRNNVTSKEMEKWYITNGVYVGCHDTLPLLLMYDVDGDHATIVSDQYTCKIVEKNMDGVLPLYYEMGKAKPQQITNELIFDSMVKAFNSGNIGSYSNKITTLWNKDNFTDNTLEAIKIITSLNNYSIDSAKTNEMPELSNELEQLIKSEQKYVYNDIQINSKGKEKQITKRQPIKLPYFFKFAKDNENVGAINNSTVNNICKKIEAIKQGKFIWKQIGKFNKNMLLHDKNAILTYMDMENIKLKSAIKGYGINSIIVNYIKEKIDDITEDVIAKYEELNKLMQDGFIKCDDFDEDMSKERMAVLIYDNLYCKFESYCNEANIDVIDATDIVVRYIFSNKKDSRKAFLFNVLGATILNNLIMNIEKKYPNCIICSCCGRRVRKTSNRQLMCEECSKERIKEKDRLRKNKIA